MLAQADKQFVGSLPMLASQHLSKLERRLLARAEQCALLERWKGREHLVCKSLLPRRGINRPHSKLALIELIYFMPNQLSELDTYPGVIIHDVGVIKFDELLKQIRRVRIVLNPLRASQRFVARAHYRLHFRIETLQRNFANAIHRWPPFVYCVYRWSAQCQMLPPEQTDHFAHKPVSRIGLYRRPQLRAVSRKSLAKWLQVCMWRLRAACQPEASDFRPTSRIRLTRHDPPSS